MTDTTPARNIQLEEEIETVERRIQEIHGEIARNPQYRPETWWHADRTRQLKAARAHLSRLNAKARAIVEQS